ncbi:hypothetical protein B7R54_03345 [Subtercola boreus]|uniref:Pilus assembly protein TadE n=1 Tax=Subtercola boreus TaxID=120213 RepID=A0A3E0VHM3_9MICO|nr:TadE family type IV pilus minor pilin [Subtercola boreus]RFA08367.1 hypothetical protein B7R54_03345 [Subtercola boreus]TQL54728.1 hypothetical protein FB464_2271 [Subtercola boreus]
MRWILDDRGTVTAEFAVALPVVLLVLLLSVAALQGAALQVRVVDAAAVAARTLARGDADADADDRVTRLVGEHSLASGTDGDFVCATVTAPIRFGQFAAAGLEARARSCALAGGQ